jgi:hypothetical protein
LDEHTTADAYDTRQQTPFNHCVHRFRARPKDRGDLANEKQRWSTNSQVMVVSHCILTE